MVVGSDSACEHCVCFEMFCDIGGSTGDSFCNVSLMTILMLLLTGVLKCIVASILPNSPSGDVEYLYAPRSVIGNELDDSVMI